MIDAPRTHSQLKALLLTFDMAKSSYCYQWQINRLADKYALIKQRMRELFEQNRSCYGYRRLHCLLKQQGIIVSEKIVRRIMKQENLTGQYTKKRRFNAYAGEIGIAAPNLVNRDFHATKPNQKWLTDITEFSLPEGRVYLSPIIDCYDGMSISWSIGTSPNAKLVNSMLDKAVATLSPNEKPIIHSDRGGHYRWPEWVNRVKRAGLTRSMSRKGCSSDNAACEGFFGSLKE